MRIFTPGERAADGRPSDDRQHVRAGGRRGHRARAATEFVFELGVGPTPVSLEWEDGGLSFAWMTQPLPSFGAIDRGPGGVCGGRRASTTSDLAAACRSQAVSCGVPFLFVPLRRARAVDSVAIDRRALAPRLRGSRASSELPVSFSRPKPRAGAARGDETVYSRMLAPGFGIAEDPGDRRRQRSARLLSGPAPRGHRRGRAVDGQPAGRGDGASEPDSHLDRGRPGAITRVRVGGRSVLVGRGELHALKLTSQRRSRSERRSHGATEERRTGDNLFCFLRCSGSPLLRVKSVDSVTPAVSLTPSSEPTSSSPADPARRWS